MSKRPNPPNGGYWYGVASSLFDAAGAEYLAGIAAYDKLPSTDPARFRFSVFRVAAGGVLTYLPLEDEGSGLSGAGNVYVRSSDGQGRYRCTSNKIAYDGPIPGFAPLPSLVALQAQITAFHRDLDAIDQELDALRLQIATLPTIVNGVLRVPPQDTAHQGGEIQLMTSDGSASWCLDIYDKRLRIHRGGVVKQYWD